MPIKYELCDFCHKAVAAKELEKITVTYKKCKECIPGKVGVTGEQVPAPEHVKKTFRQRPIRPPAFLEEAFHPPAELQPKVIVPPLSPEEIEAQKRAQVNVKPIEPTTVQVEKQK